MDKIQLHERDFIWFIGWMEGEGSFMAAPPSSIGIPRISGCSKDCDVIERICSFLGVKSFQHRKHKNNPKWADTHIFSLKGRKAYILMREMKPHMSKRRQQQIEKAMSSYIPSTRGKLNREQVLEIMKLLDLNVSVKDIALQFSVDVKTIYNVKNKTYEKFEMIEFLSELDSQTNF